MKNKILSISLISLFSVGLWISVALSNNYIITVKVPVRFVDLPPDYSVEYATVDEVFLQIKGKGWDLLKLQVASSLGYEIPVHKKVGKHRNNLLDFVESNTWLNAPTEIIDIAPNQIEYDIEKSGTRTSYIKANLDLQLSEGYGIVSGINVEPAIVEVTGSSELLKRLDSVKTEFKRISDIEEDIKITIPLEKINGISFSANECKVSFEVQKIVDKSFDNLLVETQNVPDTKELDLYPGKINIVLRGGINRLGKLTNDSIKVYVDFWSAMKEASGKIQPTIEIPKFTTIINVEPNTLDYIIKQH